jgi:hypothetical protein
LEGSASRGLERVQVSVLGADEEVRRAISVPVDDGGGGINMRGAVRVPGFS